LDKILSVIIALKFVYFKEKSWRIILSGSYGRNKDSSNPSLAAVHALRLLRKVPAGRAPGVDFTKPIRTEIYG
jgi:hypothetical protein